MDDLKKDREKSARMVVEAAYRVHKNLGPGLLERVYEACLTYELEQAGCRVARQVPVPIKYGALTFNEGFRLDILVDDEIVVELKATDNPQPVWQAQLLSYLRLTGKRIGFLINFNTVLFKDGIQRFVL
ncbi:MAG: GxxExxY protein [Geothermobacteraceae bacterium]